MIANLPSRIHGLIGGHDDRSFAVLDLVLQFPGFESVTGMNRRGLQTVQGHPGYQVLRTILHHDQNFRTGTNAEFVTQEVGRSIDFLIHFLVRQRTMFVDDGFSIGYGSTQDSMKNFSTETVFCDEGKYSEVRRRKEGTDYFLIRGHLQKSASDTGKTVVTEGIHEIDRFHVDLQEWIQEWIFWVSTVQ